MTCTNSNGTIEVRSILDFLGCVNNVLAYLQIKNIDGSPTFSHSNVNIVVVVDNK